MQITIDLPEDLANRLNLYLQEHPEESLLGILKEALEVKLVPKDRQTPGVGRNRSRCSLGGFRSC